MESIEWIYKIRKTDQNNKKMSGKEDWLYLYFLISTQ